MGGEKARGTARLTAHHGSPPHGRGKAMAPDAKRFHAGITPAWAGKRQYTYLFGVVWQDHPRMGGEKMQTVSVLQEKEGSPPHGRGKDRFPAGCPPLLRITPAWAGKSSNKIRCSSLCQDHPRMGGEKYAGTMSATAIQGSPPHGRGKVQPSCKMARLMGITPAWAGKSRCCSL